MSSHTESQAPVRDLPGQAIPYYLADGDGRAHLLLGQVGRALAGTEETAGAMSVMTALGPAGQPIPMHYHEKEHDYFFCVRGRIQVWADGESRILGPGDVASVPPGVAHAYQFHDHYSQFMGPIAPAGWDRFFDFTGSAYAGPAYPQVDPSSPPFERFGAAEGKFGMKYVMDRPYTEASTGPDDALPGTSRAYFLRAGEGPRHTMFGQVCWQVLTGAESAGALGMTVTEGPRGDALPVHAHPLDLRGGVLPRGPHASERRRRRARADARGLLQHPGWGRAYGHARGPSHAIREHVRPGGARAAVRARRAGGGAPHLPRVRRTCGHERSRRGGGRARRRVRGLSGWPSRSRAERVAVAFEAERVAVALDVRAVGRTGPEARWGARPGRAERS